MSKEYFRAKVSFIPKTIKLNQEEVNKYIVDSLKIDMYLAKIVQDKNATKIFPIDDVFVQNAITDYWIHRLRKQSEDEIIFEIIEDENGCKYAKEIYTGCLFPIVSKNDFCFKYESKAVIYELVLAYTALARAYKYSFEIQNMSSYNNPFYQDLKTAIWSDNYQIVNEDEVKKYLKRLETKTIFGKKKINEKNVNRITNLSKENALKSNIREKEEVIVEREKNDDLSIIMENIEFLLHKLDTINHELALKKKEEYQKYIKSDEDSITLFPLTIESLIGFEAELELLTQFPNQQNNDIVSFFENILKEYDSNEKTIRDINEIDRLCKIFFQTKNNLSFTVRRKATENIALIYIYEIHENKDSIKLEDLKNSYFNDLLKMIFISIDDMMKNGIIENNLLIDYNHEITPAYVLDLIKQMKFIQKEKGKQKQIADISNN